MEPGTAAVRPRILVLSTRNPYPPRQGDDVRLVGLLRAAATLGDTTLAVWGQAGARDGAEVPVQVFPLTQWAFVSGVVRHQLSGRPLVVGPYSRGFPMVVGTWDLVVGFQLKTWRWATVLSADRRVLDIVDSLARYAQSAALPAGKRLQLRGAGREEVQAGRMFDWVWVSSQADQDYLANAIGAKLQVVANGPLEIHPLPLATGSRRLLFVANHNYPPNRQGLRWFLQEVWPRLVAEGFSLDLVGKGSEVYARYPGVSAHGPVEAVDAFYAKACCAISPVWWGGGSQSKIWEALGYGRCIVVRPEGAVGIPPRPEVEMALRRDDWVAAVKKVASGAKPLDVFPTTVTAQMSRALSTVLPTNRSQA